MRRKKNISLDDEVIVLAETKANKLGFNFSAYLTHLIINDNSENLEIIKKPKKEKNTKVSNAIDDILG